MTIEQKQKFFNLSVPSHFRTKYCATRPLTLSRPYDSLASSSVDSRRLKLDSLQRVKPSSPSFVVSSRRTSSRTTFGFKSVLSRSRILPNVDFSSSLQVLSPARESLIRRTIESLKDARNVIFHMYNAAAPVFRDQVFGNSKEQTIALAVKHVKLVRELIDEAIARGDRTQWQFEYSPEAFSQTEPDFAVELCNAVQEAWFNGKDKSKERPIIFNLPATVEVATPNNYADQVSFSLS